MPMYNDIGMDIYIAMHAQKFIYLLACNPPPPPTPPPPPPPPPPPHHHHHLHHHNIFILFDGYLNCYICSSRYIYLIQNIQPLLFVNLMYNTLFFMNLLPGEWYLMENIVELALSKSREGNYGQTRAVNYYFFST